MQVFKDRTVGFWLGFVSAVIMFISDMVFIIINHADRTFSFVTFIFILLGVAGASVMLFKDYKYLPLIPSVCFAVALGMHVNLALGTLSDVVNDVNFIGGNATVATVFMIIFGICTIMSVASCFMEQRKPQA